MASSGKRSNRFTQTFAIVVVDDGSEDVTAETAKAAAVQLLRAPAPPPGWTGKLWRFR